MDVLQILIYKLYLKIFYKKNEKITVFYIFHKNCITLFLDIV